MATVIQEIIDVRKTKKALYISLLNKGLKNLTETEIQILNHLCLDHDIQLLLKNGDVFKLFSSRKEDFNDYGRSNCSGK
jgi:hypothetical protein